MLISDLRFWWLSTEFNWLWTNLRRQITIELFSIIKQSWLLNTRMIWYFVIIGASSSVIRFLHVLTRLLIMDIGSFHVVFGLHKASHTGNSELLVRTALIITVRDTSWCLSSIVVVSLNWCMIVSMTVLDDFFFHFGVSHGNQFIFDSSSELFLTYLLL